MHFIIPPYGGIVYVCFVSFFCFFFHFMFHLQPKFCEIENIYVWCFLIISLMTLILAIYGLMVMIDDGVTDLRCHWAGCKSVLMLLSISPYGLAIYFTEINCIYLTQFCMYQHSYRKYKSKLNSEYSQVSRPSCSPIISPCEIIMKCIAVINYSPSWDYIEKKNDGKLGTGYH